MCRKTDIVIPEKEKPMKLIDVDILKQDVLALPDCDNGFSNTYDKSLIIGLIDEQVAVDAIPIVRCKDCKYKPIEKEYQYPEKDSLGFVTGFWKCKRIESPIDFSPCPCVQGDDKFYHWIPDDDWYCKEGEPK